MTTHYHLAIQTEHPNLHEFMHYLNRAMMNVSRESLLTRGRNHAGRDRAMYLCREVGQKKLRKIGEVFGVKSAAVSLAVKRVRVRVRKD